MCSTGPDAVIGDFGIAVAGRARSGGDNRRRHALLSYMFGTGILAVAINLVTNLGQSS
jgi:hypothetical protein